MFPIKLDAHIYAYNKTFKGHFYAIKEVIENLTTRSFFIKSGLIINNKNFVIMMNDLANKISKYFLQVTKVIKSKIKIKNINTIHIGLHIRTGEADGKKYLLNYLKHKDIVDIFNYVYNTTKKKNVYISSDSTFVKRQFQHDINNIIYINSSICNSGFGLLKINNRCAVEAVIDYYILSVSKYLILTRCSTFSLVSLFASNIITYKKKNYKFFGKCSLHSDLYT